MKIRLTLTTTALLLIAMLLVNIVLITFWKRDAIQREAERDQAILAYVQQRFAAGLGIEQFRTFVEFYPDNEAGQLTFWLHGSTLSDNLPRLLVVALHEAAAGHSISHTSFSLVELLRGNAPILVSARPIFQHGKAVGAVAVHRSLTSVMQTLWQAEKIVLIYIAVNLLVLGIISFFRMTNLIVRPIDRLIELAAQHSDQDAIWFAAENSGSEFNQLANSLNSMVAKMEADRQILRKTVAELKNANHQLHERQQEMIRAEKLASVGRMAAGLAHEIGNPLAVIQGYLGLLSRDNGQSKDNQDFIRRANQELQRVSELVRQLLDCARISKGKPEKISLHELLYSVSEMVQVQTIFQHIVLTIKAEAAQDIIYADPDQLRQVLLNCLLNSADAINSRGQRNGKITLSTDLPKPHLLSLRIEDNGNGITAEQIASIFDPFYTTKEPGQGTGLGLSVSRSMVETAGGFMKMESRVGQGSVMSIYLPLADGGKANG